MNYSREAILPGERVLSTVYQLQIIIKSFRVFNKIISLSHILIQTDKELILIEDENSEKKSNSARYGGVWSYIPLKKIKGITVETYDKRDFFTLNIHLQGDTTIHMFFIESKKAEIDTMIDSLTNPKIEV